MHEYLCPRLCLLQDSFFITCYLIQNSKHQYSKKQGEYKQSMQSSNPVLQYFLGAGVAVFPSIGFLYQYRLINSRKSVGTFSIYVCGVMFLCNFLRIGFFIYKQFSIALLLQSVLNILMQILLLNLCIKTMNAEGYFQQNHNQNDSQDRSCLKNFWKWKQINKYFVVVLFGALLILILGVFIRKYDLENAGQCLGYAAMTAETFLLIPQIIQNLRQQKVKGISYIFVGLNTLQDALELAYVLLYSQPLQFLIFNSLQLLTNILLIIQIAIYKNCYKNTDQKEQEKGMVQFHENSQETKHDQILSGHEIICINPSDVNHSSKSEQFPLKRLEGSVQKYQKKSLPNNVQ